jgi:sulfonate transport system permease protein
VADLGLETETLRADSRAAVRRARRKQRLIRTMITVLVVFGLAGIWQILSYFFPNEEPSPLVPGWDWIFTRALPEIANYGGEGFGLPVGEGGVRGTYGGAFRAIAEHSADTWARVLAGLTVGAVGGTGLALAISWSRWARGFLALPAHVMRTLPLLALIPLFQLWFGVNFVAVLIFIAYGTGVVFFVGALNAVGNVAPIYLDNARTLGASDFKIYRQVVVPAIFPELRTTVMIGLGVAWSAVVGAEFLGTQTGLGFIEAQARQFALLDRMVVVGLCFLVYAVVSFLLFDILTRPLIRWMPTTTRSL